MVHGTYDIRRVMLVAVALSCHSVEDPAIAGTDGNKLFQACQNNDRLYGVCLGYVIGVEDALDGQLFCVPTGVQAGQVIDVVKSYLLDHPEKRHLQAADLVTAALREKFPCN